MKLLGAGFRDTNIFSWSWYRQKISKNKLGNFLRFGRYLHHIFTSYEALLSHRIHHPSTTADDFFDRQACFPSFNSLGFTASICQVREMGYILVTWEGTVTNFSHFRRHGFFWKSILNCVSQRFFFWMAWIKSCTYESRHWEHDQSYIVYGNMMKHVYGCSNAMYLFGTTTLGGPDCLSSMIQSRLYIYDIFTWSF